MKTVIVTIIVSLLACAGCQEYAAGVASGAAAMKAMGDDAQDKFIIAVNELNAETAKLNAEIEAVENIKPSDFIKQETITTIEGLKGKEKSPVFWITLVSMLGNAVWGGRTIEKRLNSNRPVVTG